MARLRLELLIESDASGGWVVRSPAVGVWSEIPAAGTSIDGTEAGVLTQAGQRIPLQLTAAAGGIVSELLAGDARAIEVEWGQELFRLAPLAGAAAGGSPTGAGGAAEEESPNVLLAPTDGVFYTRPAPGAPAFVNPGDTLTEGQAVGLIEVMKTFNHVLFAGAGLPASATVVAFLVGDGEELAAGEPILRYAPTD